MNPPAPEPASEPGSARARGADRPADSVADEAPATQTSKGRILVVDDDRLVLLTLTNGLRQAGFEVVDADNGDEAILLAREQRPELALLDIRMEGLSGFDVAETLRDVYRIPFMFLSAFADEATLAKVRELGALDYLTKPLDVERILPSVAAALARARSEAAPAATGLSLAPTPAATPGLVRAKPHGSLEGPGGRIDEHGAAAAAALWADPVPLAVGVLMHRHSLARLAAWQRLQRMATENRINPALQADRLLAAVEELSRTAP